MDAYVPVLDPAAAMPVARPIRLEKYVIKMITPDPNTKPIPIPVIIPCTSKSCHHCVQKLVRRTDTNINVLPPLKQSLK